MHFIFQNEPCIIFSITHTHTHTFWCFSQRLRYYILILIVYFHFFPYNIFYKHFQIKGNVLFLLFWDALNLLWTFLTNTPTHSKQCGHTIWLSTTSGFCLQLTHQEPGITRSSCLATIDRSLAITALIWYKTQLDVFWIFHLLSMATIYSHLI